MSCARYVFDVVFGPDSTQEEVYTATTKHLVDNVMKVVKMIQVKMILVQCFLTKTTRYLKIFQLDNRYPLKNIYFYRCQGYNATVFAYGATGGGKTYTMVGAHDNPGIMVRALNDLFRAVAEDTDNSRKVKFVMILIIEVVFFS